MATASDTDYEQRSRELVEEFLRRDILPPEAVQRVERLYLENRTTEALEVILAERRDRE
jgi:hypothetical protein